MKNILSILIMWLMLVSVSQAQFDIKYTTNPNATVKLPNLADGSTWNIGIQNGDFQITMKMTSYEAGNVLWTVPCIGSTNVDSLISCVPGTYGISYKNGGPFQALTAKIHYFVNTINQTLGSSTYGQMPDTIHVAMGTQATVSIGNNFIYRWWGEVGQSGTGGTSATTTLSAGTYWCRAKDADGYFSYDTITVIEGPVGIDTPKSSSDDKVAIYPNPVIEIANLSTSVDEVSVIDITGNMVWSATNTDQLNLSGLPSGVYFVKTSRSGYLTVTRILKK